MKKMMLFTMSLVLLLCLCSGAHALSYGDTIAVSGEMMTVAQALSTRTYLILDMYNREAAEIMLAINSACGKQAMNELAITGNWDERVYWLERAAQEGNGFAMYLLWQEYLDVDDEKAITYLKLAAEQGVYHAHYELAMGYLTGEIGDRWDKVGFDVDWGKGLSLLASAAEADVTEALEELGFILENGLYGQKKDRNKAFDCYMRVREHGAYLNMEYLTALDNLALLCEEGSGGVQDDELTFKLFYEAKEHPLNHYCTYSIWDAKLIRMYAEGRGTKQDIGKAWAMIEELREDCEGEDVDWTNAIGLMYEKGYGVKKDMAIAERYYQEAREIEHEIELANREE